MRERKLTSKKRMMKKRKNLMCSSAKGKKRTKNNLGEENSNVDPLQQDVTKTKQTLRLRPISELEDPTKKLESSMVPNPHIKSNLVRFLESGKVEKVSRNLLFTNSAGVRFLASTKPQYPGQLPKKVLMMKNPNPNNSPIPEQPRILTVQPTSNIQEMMRTEPVAMKTEGTSGPTLPLLSTRPRFLKINPNLIKGRILVPPTSTNSTSQTLQGSTPANPRFLKNDPVNKQIFSVKIPMNQRQNSTVNPGSINPQILKPVSKLRVSISRPILTIPVESSIPPALTCGKIPSSEPVLELTQTKQETSTDPQVPVDSVFTFFPISTNEEELTGNSKTDISPKPSNFFSLPSPIEPDSTSDSGSESESEAEIVWHDCVHCKKAFLTQLELVDHLKELSRLCDSCEVVFQSAEELKTHLKDAHNIKGYRCSNCKFFGISLWDLKLHQAKALCLEYKYPCEDCDCAFNSSQKLQLHVDQVHDPGSQSSFLCDVCGKALKNSYTLKCHIQSTHKDIKFPCKQCDQILASKQHFIKHMREHNIKERLVCEQCGKEFYIPSELRVHMRQHTGERPFVCSICSKSFAKRTTLKQHLLTHTGKRPYVCDICGKAFTQKPGLTGHRKSHPGILPPMPSLFIDEILKDLPENAFKNLGAKNDVRVMTPEETEGNEDDPTKEKEAGDKSEKKDENKRKKKIKKKEQKRKKEAEEDEDEDEETEESSELSE